MNYENGFPQDRKEDSSLREWSIGGKDQSGPGPGEDGSLGVEEAVPNVQQREMRTAVSGARSHLPGRPVMVRGGKWETLRGDQTLGVEGGPGNWI